MSGRSEATRLAYVSDLAAFAEWVGRSGIEEPDGVDRLQLRRYLASLGTRRLSRATVARRAASLRCYFAWLVREGRLAEDPARSLRAPGQDTLRQDTHEEDFRGRPSGVESLFVGRLLPAIGYRQIRGGDRDQGQLLAVRLQ